MIKSLAATSLSQCVAIHEGALIPFNYYGRTVVARVEQVRSQNDDDVIPTAPHDVSDLTTRFKGTEKKLLSPFFKQTTHTHYEFLLEISKKNSLMS